MPKLPGRLRREKLMILAYWAFSSTRDQKTGSLRASWRIEKPQSPSPVTAQTANNLLDRQNQPIPAMPPIKMAIHPKLTLGFAPPLMGALIQMRKELRIRNSV